MILMHILGLWRRFLDRVQPFHFLGPNPSFPPPRPPPRGVSGPATVRRAPCGAQLPPLQTPRCAQGGLDAPPRRRQIGVACSGRKAPATPASCFLCWSRQKGNQPFLHPFIAVLVPPARQNAPAAPSNDLRPAHHGSDAREDRPRSCAGAAASSRRTPKKEKAHLGSRAARNAAPPASRRVRGATAAKPQAPPTRGAPPRAAWRAQSAASAADSRPLGLQSAPFFWRDAQASGGGLRRRARAAGLPRDARVPQAGAQKDRTPAAAAQGVELANNCPLLLKFTKKKKNVGINDGAWKGHLAPLLHAAAAFRVS